MKGLLKRFKQTPPTPITTDHKRSERKKLFYKEFITANKKTMESIGSAIKRLFFQLVLIS